MDACLAIGINNGCSAHLIATALGVTRNAVLGRKFRLGLCDGKKPTQPKFRAGGMRGRDRKPRKSKRDGIIPLGHAARACGFTVAELKALRKEFQEDGL